MTELEKLIAINDIRELMARYVRHADYKQFDELAALFTPTGTFTPLRVDGSEWLNLAGREAIAKTISEGVGSAVAIHHLFSYETDILSPTTARSVISMEDQVIHSEDEVLLAEAKVAFRTMHGYGHYHGDFVKEGGRWYIDKLVQTRLKVDFTK